MELESRGHPLHTRSLTIETTLRDDGRWHVRSEVVDLRKCSFVPMVDDIQPAGIIHHMQIDFELDLDTLVMDDIAVQQPQVAVEPSKASLGECCRDAGPSLTELSGQALDDGFLKRLGLHYGGPRGCSHLLTLFQLVANTLPVAVQRERAAREHDGGVRQPGERPFRRSAFVEGFDTGGPILLAAQMGDFDSTPRALTSNPMSRLARHHDVRVEVEIGQGDRALTGLKVAERTRDGATLKTAEWEDRLPEVAELEGAPIAPGLARRVIGLVGDRDDRRELRDLLLQLAPGYVQVLAAISERFYGAAKTAEEVEGAASNAATGGGVEMLGGMTDSCWMWRSGGPLQQTRAEVAPGSMEQQPSLADPPKGAGG